MKTPTISHKLVCCSRNGSAHELCCLDLELLALEVNQTTVEAEEFPGLCVLLAIHKVELFKYIRYCDVMHACLHMRFFVCVALEICSTT